MTTFSISDRGLTIKRRSPEQSLADVVARRRSVVRALEILRSIVRPLSLEITFGPMDPDTFAVTPVMSRRVASRSIPGGVAHQSALAQPAEIELVDSLTPDVVMNALTPRDSGWDFSTIAALVTAARTDARELHIDRIPTLRVPMTDADGARWAVGPIDVGGGRLLPPIGLLWQQEWGDLELTIEAFWSLWWSPGSAEYVALRDAERELDTAGFVA
jgi:hypothetical protein